MALVKPNKPEEALEVGASYEFVIVSREDENGQLMLSRRRIMFSQVRISRLHPPHNYEGHASALACCTPPRPPTCPPPLPSQACAHSGWSSGCRA